MEQLRNVHPIYSGRQTAPFGKYVGASAGVTQEEGHTGFLIHLPSTAIAFIFLSREGFSRPFRSSTVQSNFVYPRHNRSTSVTTPRFELTSHCQKVSRLPTELPGQPACKAKETSSKYSFNRVAVLITVCLVVTLSEYCSVLVWSLHILRIKRSCLKLDRKNVFFPIPVPAKEFRPTRRVRPSRPASD